MVMIGIDPHKASHTAVAIDNGGVAAIVIGQVGDIARFATADRFAAYNGTAPIEWSSGNPKRPVHRLLRRGNRPLNHAIHIVAVTQLRYAHSPGRAFYDRKRSEGQTGREAIRSLKRRISDVIYRHLVARRDTTSIAGPGGQFRTRLHKPAWPAQRPDTGASAEATPHDRDASPTIRPCRRAPDTRPNTTHQTP
jgi:hypothetical protein